MTLSWFSRHKRALLTFGGMAFVLFVFLAMAWERRWISDDGLIYVRTVRQILDGHGPTFNIAERAEANTSALWPWFVAAITAIVRADACHVAVFGGIACTVVGVALAMLTTRRWHVMRGTKAVLVPGSIVLVLGMYPYWDYASSGLENGFCILWVACAWFALVRMRGTPSTRAQYLAAFALGLGPLSRPDLALVSGVFLVAGWLLLRPTRRRTIALLATAIAFPVAFEIFRAGYYGTLVPLPALAKSATHAEWERGFLYLLDVVRPYWLIIPIPALAAIGVYALRRVPASRADRIVAVTPIIAAVLVSIYILRVGGDFMHGRMWLTPLFLAALPATMLPFDRATAVPIGVVWLWAAVIGPVRNDHKNNGVAWFTNDERLGYATWTGEWNPIDDAPFIHALRGTQYTVADAVKYGRHLMVTEGGSTYPLAADVREPIVYVAGRLGTGGVVTPLDGFVADTLGLSNPLGARITQTHPDGGPGHQKSIPMEWLIADFSDPREMKPTASRFG